MAPYRRSWWSQAALVFTLVVAFGIAASCSGSDGSKASGKSSTTVRRAADGVTKVRPSDDDLAAAFGSGFDPVTSPDPKAVTLADGTTAWVVDTGPADGTPVLFVGGTGTSATVVRLVEFVSSAREKLGIRLISIDRNGFGDAPLDEAAGYDQFASTALGVLDALGVEKFSIVGISGGGPYTAAVSASALDRVRSVHLAAAYTGDPIAGSLQQLCGLPRTARDGVATSSAADPAGWWAFPSDAPVHRIPGFVEAAVADAVRTFRVEGDNSDPAGLIHEFNLFCEPTPIDLSAVKAPVFLYYGDTDTTVPGVYADQWRKRYPNVAADRRFPNVAHDVTYRHWGQVLVDIASPDRQRTLYCMDGRTQVTDGEAVPTGAVLDYCAWAG